MKRLLLLLLATLLMLTSCGTTQEEKSTEVELTVDNLLEYVEFSPHFTNYDPAKYSSLIFHHYDFSYDCHAIREGWFSNVEIKVEVILNDRWFIDGTQNSEGVFKQKIVSTIELDYDGSYESDSYKVFAQQNLTPTYQFTPETKVEEFKIISVSGTFIED